MTHRGGSFYSTISEDGLTHKATICERAQNNGDGDLEKRLKEDKEKAIAMLKRVHFFICYIIICCFVMS